MMEEWEHIRKEKNDELPVCMGVGFGVNRQQISQKIWNHMCKLAILLSNGIKVLQQK